MLDMRFPDLSGKIVLIYLTNQCDEHNVVLEHARFEQQGDKLFIVGVFAEGTTANDWATGIHTAVAWSNVEQYLAFDSLEDYFYRISLANENQTLQ
jgi:hypothetical protein